MKARIEQIARESGFLPVHFNRSSRKTEYSAYPDELEKFANAIRNEALELAAREQERRSTERHGHDKYEDAAAIREMKVSE